MKLDDLVKSYVMPPCGTVTENNLSIISRCYGLDYMKVVTPVNPGVQMLFNYFNILYSGFRRNNRKRCFPTFHASIKLELVEKCSQVTSLVAELDGKIISFIIGDVSSWEYDVPENIGWIDTIGENPDYQRKGIEKILFTEMTNNLKKVGVDTIYTFVTRRG